MRWNWQAVGQRSRSFAARDGCFPQGRSDDRGSYVPWGFFLEPLRAAYACIHQGHSKVKGWVWPCVEILFHTILFYSTHLHCQLFNLLCYIWIIVLQICRLVWSWPDLWFMVGHQWNSSTSHWVMLIYCKWCRQGYRMLFQDVLTHCQSISNQF